MLKQLLTIGLLSASFSTLANWQLENNSSKVSFVSVKKDIIGEVHHFKSLTGEIDDKQKLSLEIDLTSVETNIPIRNERMQNMLFNTKTFPTLTLTANVTKELGKLEQGHTAAMKVPATLSLMGIEKEINVDVFAAKTKANTLLVSSMSPIIINTADFGLTDGINALQKVAGLPNIAKAVPVTFVLHFTQQ